MHIFSYIHIIRINIIITQSIIKQNKNVLPSSRSNSGKVRTMKLLRFVTVLTFTLVIFYFILLSSGVSVSYLQKMQQNAAAFPGTPANAWSIEPSSRRSAKPAVPQEYSA